MTKDEFYEEITDFEELVDFCCMNDCIHIIEDLKRSDDFDEWVWEQLEDLRSRWYWYDLRNALSDIEAPNGDYFIPGGDLNYTDLSMRDFYEYQEQVIDWGDEVGFWDEEEDEDECVDIEEDEDEPSFESEIALTILIGVA